MIIVNWLELSEDLVIRIVENQLTSVDDFIVFSSVCHSWNRATHACNKFRVKQIWLRRQMPWLMLTDGNDNEFYSNTGGYRGHETEDDYEDDYEDEIDYEDDYEDETEDEDVYEDESNKVQSGEKELMVDSCYNLDADDGTRTLFNLSNSRNKGYSLSLPQLYGKACWGSRYGWIVTLGLDRRMHLFNPLTKAQLPLPSQTTFRCPWSRARGATIRLMFLSKIVLLRVPQDDRDDDNRSWLVVAIHRSYLHVAIARPGDKSWTDLKLRGISLMDVIYCTKLKSLIFVDDYGDLWHYDIHNSKQPQEFQPYLEGPDVKNDLLIDCEVEAFTYLVQCGGTLLIIARDKRLSGWRNLDSNHYQKTENFRVFRFCPLTKSWDALSHLGNVALFVGGNETTCIDTLDGGCRSNCVYFSDEDCKRFRYNRDKVGGHDMGVFNLSDKTIEPIYDGNNSKSSYCTPFWFSPSIF